MKKAIFAVLTLVIVAVVAAGIWLYSSIDSILQAAIEDYGPDITQTTVKVAGVKLSPTQGTGSITGLRIGNPKGFKTDHAFNAGAIELAIDGSSITKDVIVVRRIAVLAPDINYETSDAGSNFDVIQKNVQGYIERTLGKSAPDKDKGPPKKFIVEALSIRDGKVSYAPALLQGKSLTVSMPNIELRNIGRARGGVTSGELAGEIVGALKAQVMHAVTQPIKGAAEAVGSAARSSATR